MSESNATIHDLHKSLSFINEEELTIRKEILQETVESNQDYLKQLSTIIHDTTNSTGLRKAAAFEMQNFFKNPKLDQSKKWTSLNEDDKSHITKILLDTLGTEEIRPSFVAPCLAFIAAIESLDYKWPELMNKIIGNITSPDTSDTLKESSLDVIGQFCIIFVSNHDCDILNVYSKTISEAVMYGMTKDTSSNYLKIAAMTALTQSFKWIKGNFESESDRHFLLQLVCYSAQSTDIDLRVAALKTLTEIVLFYYPSMDLYIKPTMFPIAIEALKSEKTEIRQQGIKFWMNVCTIEANLQRDNSSFEFWNSLGFDKPPNFKSRCYVKVALPFLMPILLEQFLKEKKLKENYDNVPTVMDDYLYYLSSCCGDSVYPYITDFMEDQMKNEDWKRQCIAFNLLLAVDSRQLKKLVKVVMPFLVGVFKDTSEENKCYILRVIRDTYNKGPNTYLSEQSIKPLVQILIKELNSSSKVAIAACETLSSLAYAAFFTPSDTKSDYESYSTKFIPSNKFCFQLIIHKILDAACRTDVIGLSKPACFALRDIIQHTPEDCYDAFKELNREILDRILSVVQTESPPHINDLGQNAELQTCLVSSLEGVLKRVRPEDAPEICDSIVFTLLQMYNCTKYKFAKLRKAVLSVVSLILLVLGDKFLMFACIVEPVLVAGLRNCNEEEVYTISLRLTRGIYKVLGWKVLPYCHTVIPILANHLKNNEVRESMKREILLVFEAIVLGVGSAITSYLSTFMPSMIEASKIEIAQFAYLNVYSQLIKVLKDDGDIYLIMQPYLPGIIRLVASVADDKCRSDLSVAAVSDLLVNMCSTLGPKIKNLIISKPIIDMIISGRSSPEDKTKAAAACAYIEMEKLKNLKT